MALDYLRYILSLIALLGILRIAKLELTTGNKVNSTVYVCLTGLAWWLTGKEIIDMISYAKQKLKDNL